MTQQARAVPPVVPAPMRRLLRESVGPDGWLLFLLCLLTFVLFPNDLTNPNARSRLFLSLSIVERGSISLGDYGPLTIDRAERDGRSYSDKAPGMAALALPVVAVVRPILVSTGCVGPSCWFDNGRTTSRYLKLQYAAIVAAAPLVAAAIVLFRAFLVVVYDDRRVATLLALTLALATPLGAWATTFFEHAVATSLLLTAFVAAHAVTRLCLPRPSGWTAGLIVGLPLALVVPVSYPAAVAGLMIAAYAAWCSRSHGASWLLKAALAAAAVGIVIAVPLLAYNNAAFGSPLSIGYGSVVGFEGMRRGLFGVSLPDPAIIWQLLVPEFRGLIWVAPIVLLYPVGLVLLLARHPELRAAGLLSAALLGYYLCLNAGYFYWDGGHSLGPRHLTPTLPFLLLVIAAVAAAWPRRGLALTALLAGLGAVVILSAMATGNVTPANEILHPITTVVFSELAAGQISTIMSRARSDTGILGFLAYLVVAGAMLVALLRRNASPLSRRG